MVARRPGICIAARRPGICEANIRDLATQPETQKMNNPSAPPTSTPMNWLHYQLALMPSPGAILHVGAGLCSELPDYQQIEPDRIILLEPNPKTINALRQKAADYDNVTILQAAVAAEAGRARLRMFNFPELDSLREPTGLYQLLPGLQQTGQTEVSTISPAQLTRRLSLEDSSNNWLVLEAPGEEAIILEELNRTGTLQNFSRLIVRTGAEPFYQGDDWSTPLLERLESFGYFVEATPDENDPDWPRFHLKFQPLALKCRDLEARVEDEGARNEQLESERSALAAELEEHRQKLDHLRAENTAKAEEIDKLNAQLTDLTKEHEQLESARQKLSEQAEASDHALEQAKAEWEKERQALEEKKSEEVDALNSRIEELEKQREELESARHELSVQAEANAHALEKAQSEWEKERQALQTQKSEETDALNSRIAKLEKERDELQSARQKLSKQVEASTHALEKAKAEWDKERQALNTEVASLTEKLEVESKQTQHLQQQLTEKNSEINSARSDLALAIRLQTLRENDLKELQTRYGEVLTIKDEQQDLLTQLHHRLSRAAEYLQLVHTQSENQRLPDELLEALTGKGEKSG